MYKRSTRALCTSAIIGALYAALTLLVPPISYGPVQCRLSEIMALLPLVLPSAVPGLTIGCLAANLLSPAGVWDVLFGTLATLLAAAGTRSLRQRPILAALCPVLVNGLLVGSMLAAVYALPAWMMILQVALGESIAVVAAYALMKTVGSKIDWKKLQ